jgi:hypothetical protein
MTYIEQWKKISGRIRGLTNAGQLYAQLRARSGDSYGGARGLRKQCEALLSELESYRSNFAQSIPPAGVSCIETFVGDHGGLIKDTSGTADSLQERVSAALVFLAAFEGELSFILDDMQETIRVRSERAFEHLQRLIVADPDVQQKWQRAFDAGEIACEKLGAAHILSHGIFAFKAHGAGERTDLVFQDRTGNLSDNQRYVDGFTLTEWKVCRRPTDAAKRFEEARTQAASYGKGVLGGTELSGYRYAIVVSEESIPVPDDVSMGNVRYRHINISTNPGTPSERARRG